MRKSEVISHFGSVKELAAKLGVSDVAIYKWEEIIPKGRAYELEKLTKGKLKVEPALYQKPSTATAA
jgi:transcriptional regulator with XRE-family HTH domain